MLVAIEIVSHLDFLCYKEIFYTCRDYAYDDVIHGIIRMHQ